ncbi:MAG: SRPBCC family protein [Verrucomicrobiales bacterium]|nr:SRPBCC family protein [Verrucomicrobiales bacterium]
MTARLLIFILPLVFLANVNGGPALSGSDWARIQKGDPVLFAQNPECPDSGSKSYVNGAVLVGKSIDAVWDVLIDPESAPSYIADLESAKIIAKRGSSLFVEQGMSVRGLRHPVKYVLRMDPVHERKVTFEFQSGKLRAMDGGWYMYPVGDGRQTLLVYSLFLDPGRMAPKSLVKRSLQKKIPETLVAVRAEVLKRANAVALAE